MTFETPGDRERFAGIVTQYAKKDEADQAGLIYQVWWQPFYRTFAPVDSMVEVRLIRVGYGGYRSNIITLMEDAAAKSKQLAERFPGMTFEISPVWVNPSFYRYMGGAFR